MHPLNHLKHTHLITILPKAAQKEKGDVDVSLKVVVKEKQLAKAFKDGWKESAIDANKDLKPENTQVEKVKAPTILISLSLFPANRERERERERERTWMVACVRYINTYFSFRQNERSRNS